MTPASHTYCSLSPFGFHNVTYLSWGSERPDNTIICVHGISRNAHDFDFLAKELSSSAHVVCPHVVGRGDSDWINRPEAYTIPQYMVDMTALISRLNVKSVDWIGTSMGGLIGMSLAAQPKSPIRRLIINDAGPFIPANAIRRIRGYIGLRPTFPTLEQAEKYFRQLYAPFGQLTDAQWEHLTQHSVKKHADGFYELNYDPAIAQTNQGTPLEDVNLWPLWTSISCPVLLIRGENSDILPQEIAEEMKAKKPNTDIVIFKDIGHAPALMDEEQIRTIQNWLDTTPY